MEIHDVLDDEELEERFIKCLNYMDKSNSLSREAKVYFQKSYESSKREKVRRKKEQGSDTYD